MAKEQAPWLREALCAVSAPDHLRSAADSQSLTHQNVGEHRDQAGVRVDSSLAGELAHRNRMGTS